MYRRSLITVACCAAAFAVQAEEPSAYPTKPVRIVVASGPGSGSDILARYLGVRLQASLGQPIIVENKPGAAGILGTNYVAREPGDGYTLTLGGASTHMLSAALYPKLPYDPVKDFATIGQIGTAAILLIANNNFPGNSLKDVIALAKKQPDGIQYASWGNGSTGQFCGEVLNQVAGIKMQHIPYKTIPQVITDVQAGHVMLGFSDITSGTAFVKAGKVKGIATCTTKSPSLPQVQSYGEAGVDFSGTFRWGLYAPRSTPKPIVEKLAHTLRETLAQPDVVSKLNDFGIAAQFLPGDELASTTSRDIENWKKVVQKAGITGD